MNFAVPVLHWSQRSAGQIPGRRTCWGSSQFIAEKRGAINCENK